MEIVWRLTCCKPEYLPHLLEVVETSHNFRDTWHTELSVNVLIGIS